MGITFEGVQNDKFAIREHDEGIRLRFEGEDADQFVQVDAPRHPREMVGFRLTLKECADFGLLSTANYIWQAIEHNDGQWSIVSLTQEAYKRVARQVFEHMTIEAQLHDGYLTEDFTAGEFDSEVEAAVAVTIANLTMAKMVAA